MTAYPPPPPPPGFAQPSNRQLAPEKKPEALKPPEPPPMVPGTGKLTDEETAYILETTLLPEHREDGYVLRFIANYLRCRDERQAAKEAGIDPRSGRNLKMRPDIWSAIVKLTEKSALKYGFDAHELVEKVVELAYFDPIELENPDGTFKKHMRDISPEARRAIKKMKVKNTYEEDINGIKRHSGEIIEFEFYEKIKPIELLSREENIFKEKKINVQEVGENMKTVLLGAQERANNRFNQTFDVTPPAELPPARGVLKEDET